MTTIVQGGGSALYGNVRNGSSDHFACACLYKVKNMKLYVLLRPYSEKWIGKKERQTLKLPGGTSHISETPLQTFRREIKEELGIVLERGEIIHSITTRDRHKKIVFAKEYSGEELRHCITIEPGYSDFVTETLGKPQWWEVGDALRDEMRSLKMPSFYKAALLKLIVRVKCTENLASHYNRILEEFWSLLAE